MRKVELAAKQKEDQATAKAGKRKRANTVSDEPSTRGVRRHRLESPSNSNTEDLEEPQDTVTSIRRPQPQPRPAWKGACPEGGETRAVGSGEHI